jgi:hypothetical protein
MLCSNWLLEHMSHTASKLQEFIQWFSTVKVSPTIFCLVNSRSLCIILLTSLNIFLCLQTNFHYLLSSSMVKSICNHTVITQLILPTSFFLFPSISLPASRFVVDRHGVMRHIRGLAIEFRSGI